MGCSSSSIPVSGRKNTPNNNDDIDINISLFKSSFECLIKDVDNFILPKNSMPSVCLKKNSFPVIMGSLISDVAEASSASLPIVTAAQVEKGRVLVLPQIQCLHNDGFTQKFIKNAISWLVPKNLSSIPIILFHINYPEINEIIAQFQQEKCMPEQYSNNIKLSNYYFMIIESNLDIKQDSRKETIRSFVSNGGGLIVVYSPSTDPLNRFPINSLLIEFGLGFSYCTELNGNQSGTLPVSQNFSDVKQAHFHQYISRYEFILSHYFTTSNPSSNNGSVSSNSKPVTKNQNSNPQRRDLQSFSSSGLRNSAFSLTSDSSNCPESIQQDGNILHPINQLDDIVTELLYCLAISNGLHENEIRKLAKISIDFLIKTGGYTNGAFCQNLAHAIVLFFLQDIYPRLPPPTIVPLPGLDFFPGSTNNLVLSDFTINLSIQDESWVSSGLYLPPGTIGVISLSSISSNMQAKRSANDKIKDSKRPFNPELRVQIGAHNNNLLIKAPPWKRWPSMTIIYSLFPSDTGSISVSSPYGGPVYFASSHELEKPVSVGLHCINFGQHPRAVKNDPNVWKKTSGSEAPFGEIETDSMIITLPTVQMRILEPKFQDIFSTIDKEIELVSRYMSYNIRHPFRIVFDIELPDNNPTCGYPIVFLIQDIQSLLQDITRPSEKKFAFLNLIALITLREDCFDSDVEQTISELIARRAFSELIPDFDLATIEVQSNLRLFEAFNQIQNEYGSDIILKALKKFQDPNYELNGMPEDNWIDFAKELCIIGNTDFTEILKAFVPLPLNVTTSIQNLCHIESEEKIETEA